MAGTFLFNTKAEILKTRGTAALWLLLLAAAFLPAINGIILIERPEIFISKVSASPWLSFLHMNWKNGASVILPVFVILINNVIVQVEYRNNTWKQVYASPRRYADIFFSKFIIVQIFLIAFFILFSLFIIFSGYAVGLLQKGYAFSAHSIPWDSMLAIVVRVYIGISGVTAIQYWISMRYKNFIVPLGVGIGLWMTGIVLMDWDKIIYYPYMYATLLYFIDSPGHMGTLSALTINSVVCFIAAVSLGFWSIYRLEERG